MPSSFILLHEKGGQKPKYSISASEILALTHLLSGSLIII
jgi:hypothetical protein